jgi:hypothetical protein
MFNTEMLNIIARCRQSRLINWLYFSCLVKGPLVISSHPYARQAERGANVHQKKMRTAKQVNGGTYQVLTFTMTEICFS